MERVAWAFIGEYAPLGEERVLMDVIAKLKLKDNGV